LHYLIINRKEIDDAVDGQLDQAAISCAKSKIYNITSSIKPSEIILIWEDRKANSFPLWVVGDKFYLETLAYIDTYVQKYTPFTAFVRVISLGTFCSIFKERKGNTNSNDFIGVVIAEAHFKFDKNMERANGLPIQAYLSTLSSTIISAINSGYSVDKLPAIVKKWEATRELLKIEMDNVYSMEVINFWIVVLNILGSERSNNTLSGTDVPNSIKNFLISFKKSGVISKNEWKILVDDDSYLLSSFSGFTGTREDGILNFKRLIENLQHHEQKSDLETQVIISAALSVISSGTMDYLSLALSISDSKFLVGHWYMLFIGMHRKQQIYATQRSVGHHIWKHLQGDSNLFSTVASDISYPELKVVLTNQLKIVPFITSYSTVIDVEIFPLVRAKFRIKRNSNVVNNETADGVFLNKNEYTEISEAISTVSAILNNKFGYKNKR